MPQNRTQPEFLTISCGNNLNSTVGESCRTERDNPTPQWDTGTHELILTESTAGQLHVCDRISFSGMKMAS